MVRELLLVVALAVGRRFSGVRASVAAPVGL